MLLQVPGDDTFSGQKWSFFIRERPSTCTPFFRGDTEMIRICFAPGGKQVWLAFVLISLASCSSYGSYVQG